MRLLLDGMTFLWAATEPARLPREVREALRPASTSVYLSAVTPWELGLKLTTGKLELDEPLATLIARLSDDLQLTNLAIRVEHALTVAHLPYHHRDPFDRMLVAQAMVEGLTIVTSDQRIPLYGVPVLW